MLAHQRRALQWQHCTSFGDRTERGIVYAAQSEAIVQPRRLADDVAVGRGVGTDDHLGRLAGRGELRRRAVSLPRVARVHDRRLGVGHRALDPANVLLGRQPLEPPDGRQLDIDRHAIGVEPGLVDQLGIGVGDRLQVDVAAEVVVLAQAPRDLDQLLHRIVRRLDDARGEEQALDIVAAIKAEGERHHFLRGEAGASDVRALAVDAIMTVEHAAVGQQDLEQADAAPVGGVGVADARPLGRSDAPAADRVALRGARRRARRIVFGGVRENRELLPDV